MIEVTGNLWTFPADFRVITTNGSIRRDGCCVMGRGCAREAAKKYPRLPKELGDAIKEGGNIPHYFNDYDLFSFPVKHTWDAMASLKLIARSVLDFRVLIDGLPDRYVMPRPGCGNGHLEWDLVKPLLKDLPDNVFVIDFPPRKA